MIHVLTLACLLGSSAVTEVTVCDTSGSGCQSEDALPYLDTSLLQVGVQYHERAASEQARDDKEKTKSHSEVEPIPRSYVEPAYKRPFPGILNRNATRRTSSKPLKVKSADSSTNSTKPVTVNAAYIRPFPGTLNANRPVSVRSAESYQRPFPGTLTGNTALHATGKRLEDARQHAKEQASAHQRTKSGAVVAIFAVIAVAIFVALGAVIVMGQPKILADMTGGLIGKGAAEKHLESAPLRTHSAPGTPLGSHVPVPGQSFQGSRPPTAMMSPQPPQSRGPSRSQDPTRSQSAQSVMSNNSAGPPPVCPTLILPHTEARFKMMMEPLRNLATGYLDTVDVLGTSGRKLLHAAVADLPDGKRCLALSSCGCEDDPRICVFFKPNEGSQNVAQEVDLFGKQGQFYGNIMVQKLSSGAMEAKLSYGSRKTPVMYLKLGSKDGDNDPKNPSLHTTALALDGKVLASAARDHDAFKMQVKPGVDAILVISCMMVLILLDPDLFRGYR